jgi:hypothetical protein
MIINWCRHHTPKPIAAMTGRLSPVLLRPGARMAGRADDQADRHARSAAGLRHGHRRHDEPGLVERTLEQDQAIRLAWADAAA